MNQMKSICMTTLIKKGGIEMKKCGNCSNRMYNGWLGRECCMGYEMALTEEEEINTAMGCDMYEKGTPSCFEDDDYCPSSTRGDYSPSNPWDAPGMSIRDFI